MSLRKLRPKLARRYSVSASPVASEVRSSLKLLPAKMMTCPPLSHRHSDRPVQLDGRRSLDARPDAAGIVRFQADAIFDAQDVSAEIALRRRLEDGVGQVVLGGEVDQLGAVDHRLAVFQRHDGDLPVLGDAVLLGDLRDAVRVDELVVDLAAAGGDVVVEQNGVLVAARAFLGAVEGDQMDVRHGRIGRESTDDRFRAGVEREFIALGQVELNLLVADEGVDQNHGDDDDQRHEDAQAAEARRPAGEHGADLAGGHQRPADERQQAERQRAEADDAKFRLGEGDDQRAEKGDSSERQQILRRDKRFLGFVQVFRRLVGHGLRSPAPGFDDAGGDEQRTGDHEDEIEHVFRADDAGLQRREVRL